MKVVLKKLIYKKKQILTCFKKVLNVETVAELEKNSYAQLNYTIQGLPSLNVGISPSCRGPQIKKNSVKIFCKSANFFAIFWNFFNINVCLKVHSFLYNNSILHNFFINDPH